MLTDDPLNAGTAIEAAHLTQLRTALDQARAALGLSPLAYTDPAITAGSTIVKTAHIAIFGTASSSDQLLPIRSR